MRRCFPLELKCLFQSISKLWSSKFLSVCFVFTRICIIGILVCLDVNLLLTTFSFSHFHKIVALGEEAHLNTCFKHFYYFIAEYKLVDKKELAPLQELINGLIQWEFSSNWKKISFAKIKIYLCVRFFCTDALIPASFRSNFDESWMGRSLELSRCHTGSRRLLCVHIFSCLWD